jgi:uncharacterized membrane protein
MLRRTSDQGTRAQAQEKIGRGALLQDRARPRLTRVSTGAAVAVGAVFGLVLGIVVGVVTDLPLAPEVGLALGALAGWLVRRGRA